MTFAPTSKGGYSNNYSLGAPLTIDLKKGWKQMHRTRQNMIQAAR